MKKHILALVLTVKIRKNDSDAFTKTKRFKKYKNETYMKNGEHSPFKMAIFTVFIHRKILFERL